MLRHDAGVEPVRPLAFRLSNGVSLSKDGISLSDPSRPEAGLHLLAPMLRIAKPLHQADGRS